jgi:hypothetical protein
MKLAEADPFTAPWGEPEVDVELEAKDVELSLKPLR